MVKLRWLQVNKFHTVKPGTRLTFNPGYNVLLGQNGTGKTTLLNLIAATVRSNFTEFKDFGFDLEYELASELGTAIIAVRNEHRSALLQAALEAPPHDIRLRMAFPSERNLQTHVVSASIDITPATGAPPTRIIIDDSRVSIQQGDPTSRITHVELGTTHNQPDIATLVASALARSHPPYQKSDFNLLRTWLFLVDDQLHRFDESLEHFEQLGNVELDMYRLPDGSINPTRSTGPFQIVVPFFDAVREHWGATRYTLGAEQFPFLLETLRLLDFDKAEASLEVQKIEGSTWAKLGNLKFFFIHRNGSVVPEKHLSYGQKRVLAFMHYMATTESIAVVDELVNGLHHRWIRACIETLGERQVFLTSQNPLLLDYLSFQSPEEVCATFVLCRWEKDPGQMIWEKMSQAAAQDFFDSYKVGFQQVGELLQSKGLW